MRARTVRGDGDRHRKRRRDPNAARRPGRQDRDAVRLRPRPCAMCQARPAGFVRRRRGRRIGPGAAQREAAIGRERKGRDGRKARQDDLQGQRVGRDQGGRSSQEAGHILTIAAPRPRRPSFKGEGPDPQQRGGDAAAIKDCIGFCDPLRLQPKKYKEQLSKNTEVLQSIIHA